MPRRVLDDSRIRTFSLFLHLFGYGDFSSRLHPSRRLAVATNFLRVRKFNSHRRNAENFFFMWLRQKKHNIVGLNFRVELLFLIWYNIVEDI